MKKKERYPLEGLDARPEDQLYFSPPRVLPDRAFAFAFAFDLKFAYTAHRVMQRRCVLFSAPVPFLPVVCLSVTHAVV